MTQKLTLRNFVSLAALATLSLSACSGDPADALNKATAELRQNDFVSARLYLLIYLKEKPNDRQALLSLARSAIYLGKGLEAEAALDRARKAGEPLGSNQDLYVEALLQQNEADKALVQIANIPEEKSARIALLRGRAYAMKGDVEKALQSLREGLVKHPDDAAIHVEKARVYLAVNDIALAEASLKTALKYDPKSHEALLVNGELLLAQGRPQMAHDQFQSALRNWPVSVRALIGKAAAEGDLGQIDAMAKSLDAVNAIDENQPIAGLLRAQLLAKRGDWSRVIEIVDTLGPKMSNQPLLFRLEGEAALARKNFERAAQALLRYLAERPNDRNANLMLAQAQFAVGDASSAQKALSRNADSASASPSELRTMAKIATALKLPSAAGYEERAKSPQHAFRADRLARGNAALNDTRWAEAIDIYEELSQATGGKDVIVNNNLGWALYKAGRMDAALKALATAARLAPNNAAVAHSFGTVLLAAGQDKPKAIGLLTKAAELKPDNARYANDLKKAKAAP